jgi:hypothetical protein
MVALTFPAGHAGISKGNSVPRSRRPSRLVKRTVAMALDGTVVVSPTGSSATPGSSFTREDPRALG